MGASRFLVDSIRVGGNFGEESPDSVMILRGSSSEIGEATVISERTPDADGRWEFRDLGAVFGETYFYWAEWNDGAGRLGPVEGLRQDGQPDVENFNRLPGMLDLGTNELTDLVKGDDRWVLLGDDDNVFISFDEGESWEAHPAPLRLNHGVYGEELFVAVRGRSGFSGSRVYYSEDGIDWVESDSGNGLWQIAHANGVFYARGTNSGYRSTDGRNWSYDRSWSGSDELFAFKGKFFQMSGGQGFSTSADGDNWTFEGYTGAASTGDSHFFYVDEDYLWMGFMERDGYSLNYRMDVYRSANGVNWSRMGWTDWLYGNNWIRPHSSANGYFYAADGYGMMRSANMLQWERVDGNRITSVYAASGGAVALGYGGFLAASSNGSDWTGLTGITNRTIRRVLHASGQWLALPEYGHPFASPDGETWNRQGLDLPDNFFWIDGAYGNGKFVLLGGYMRDVGAMTTPSDYQTQRNTVVAVSSDGANWELRTAIPWDSPDVASWFPQGISYANGHFYITTYFSSATPLWQSADGLSWSAIQFPSSGSNTGRAVWGVAYLNDRYHLHGFRQTSIVGASTAFHSSDDLGQWSYHGQGLPSSLRFLTKFNGRIWGGGTKLISTDSLDSNEWRIEPGVETVGEMLVTGDTAIIVGESGAFASSEGGHWFYSDFNGFEGLSTAATDGQTILAAGSFGTMLRALPTETDVPEIVEDWTSLEVEYGEGLVLDLNPENADYPYSVEWYAGETGDEGELLGSDTKLEFPVLTDSLPIWYRLENEWGTAVSGTIEIHVLPPVPAYVGDETISLVEGEYSSFGLAVTWAPDEFRGEGLPSGLVLDGATGRISGIPEAVGDFTATFEFPLGEQTGTAEILFNILPAKPSITSPASFTGRVGRVFTYQITIDGVADSVAVQGLPGGLSYDSANRVISGTPSSAGSWSTTITAANATGSTARTLALTIYPAQQAPAITSASLVSTPSGTFFEFVLAAQSSVDSFRVEALPEWLSFDESTGVLSGTPAAPDELELVVSTMKDGVEGPRSVIELFVEASANAPRLRPITPMVVVAGEVLDVPLDTDIPADAVQLESATEDPLPTWLSVGEGPRLLGAAGAAGRYLLRLTPVNEEGAGPSVEVALTVLAPPDAPRMIGVTGLIGRVGEAFSHQLESTGGTIGIAGELPAGLQLNGNGLLEGIPQEEGQHEISFFALDGSAAGGERIYGLWIESAEDSPDADLVPELHAVMGVPFSSPIEVADEGDTLEVEGLPDGIRWDADSGQLVGIPEEGGVFPLVVNVQRDGVTGARREAVLAVEIPFARARLLGPETVRVRAGQGITLTYSADLSDGDELLTVNLHGLPPGLDWEPDTLRLSGEIPSAGRFAVVVEPVTQTGVGHRLETVFEVSASTAVPRITNDPEIRLVVGEELDYQFEAAPGPVSAFQASNLPDGFSLNRATGRLTGISLETGEFPIEVFASSGAGTGSGINVVLKVEPGDNSPVLQTKTVWNLKEGESMARELFASNLPPHSPSAPLPDGYGYRAEDLPPGLVLDGQSGLISGTPVSVGEFGARVSAYSPSTTGRESTLRIRVTAASSDRPFIDGPDWVVLDAGTPASYTFAPRNAGSGARIQAGSAGSWGRVTQEGGTTFGIEGLTPGAHTLTLRLIEWRTYPYTYRVSRWWGRSSYSTGYRTEPITVAVKNVNVYVRPSGLAIPSPIVPEIIFGRTGTVLVFDLILPDTPSASYRLRGGLPAGVEFDGHRFYGTPREPGDYVVSLVTETPEGNSVPANLLLRILPSLEAPTLAGLISAPEDGESVSGFQAMGGGQKIHSVNTYETSVATPSFTVNLVVDEPARLAVASEGEVDEVIAENLPEGLFINSNTGVIAGTPARPGRTESFVTLSGQDGRGARRGIVFDVSPKAGTPEIVLPGEWAGRVGEYFAATVEVAGVADEFWVEGLPDGLDLDSETGQIKGGFDAPGIFPLTVFAWGAAGEAKPVSLLLAVRGAEGTPEIAGSFGWEAQVDSPFSQALEATAFPDRFRVDDLPEGLYFDETTSTIEGTPLVAGIFEARIQALNSVGWGDVAAVQIDVKGRAGTVDVVAEDLPGIVRTGDSVAWEVSSADANAQYTARGLPPGLSMDPLTGMISGTAGESGLFSVSVMAMNAAGQGSETRVTMRVGGPGLSWLADRFGEAAVLSSASLDGLWAEDVDGDGHSNLLEYSLGGDPHVPNTVRLPELAVDPVTNDLRLDLWRSESATDVELEVEYAPVVDARSWERLGSPAESASSGELRRETYRNLPADASQGFYRLRVRAE